MLSACYTNYANLFKRHSHLTLTCEFSDFRIKSLPCATQTIFEFFRSSQLTSFAEQYLVLKTVIFSFVRWFAILENQKTGIYLVLFAATRILFRAKILANFATIFGFPLSLDCTRCISYISLSETFMPRDCYCILNLPQAFISNNRKPFNTIVHISAQLVKFCLFLFSLSSCLILFEMP